MMFGLETIEAIDIVGRIITWTPRMTKLSSLTTAFTNWANMMLQHKLITLEVRLERTSFIILDTPKVHPKCSLLYLTTMEISMIRSTCSYLWHLSSIQLTHLMVCFRILQVLGDCISGQLHSYMYMKSETRISINIREIFAMNLVHYVMSYTSF